MSKQPKVGNQVLYSDEPQLYTLNPGYLRVSQLGIMVDVHSACPISFHVPAYDG
jgi:hypothetical protein